MRFLFGRSHFKIRSYNPYELGLTQKTASDFTIEVRQICFHLFRLPFFGLGKEWSIRKNDQLFELPDDYKDAVLQQGELSTPLYAYAGSLLLTLAGLCFVVNTKYVYWERHRDFRNEYISTAADNSNKFRTPASNDYYVLAAADGSEKYARINRFDSQNIHLSYINNPYIRADRPGQMAAFFADYARQIRTITISRADSARLICREYEKRHSFKGMPLNNDDGKAYRLQAIIRMDGPIFKDDGYAGQYADGRYSFSMNIENEGLPATITRITPVEGDIEWIADVLPLESRPEQRIALHGKGNVNKSYKLMLICTDEQGRELQYLMEGRHLHNTFRKIEL